ncbi:MAG: FadR/GntR family transcriptional regulator [Rhodovibrionaceae bacterium]
MSATRSLGLTKAASSPANSTGNSTGLPEDLRFQQIERERVSDRVAQELLKLIGSGRLAPGERLPGERQLAEMMNVSRVSIRAALQQLKAKGLITSVQGGGTRIAKAAEEIERGLSSLVRANSDNLFELIEIRAMLEVWAARRAAEDATPEQQAAIRAAFARMDVLAADDPGFAERDMEFHLAIAKASGSAIYLHLMDMLEDVLKDLFAVNSETILRAPENRRAIQRQHAAILEAIEARCGDGAAAAMRAHLGFILDKYGFKNGG